MIIGRFGETTGRPYIEGRLVIPAFGIQADISFLVDTGADRTVLLPADAMRSGLDFAKLDGGEDVGGVGGTISMFTQAAFITVGPVNSQGWLKQRAPEGAR